MCGPLDIALHVRTGHLHSPEQGACKLERRRRRRRRRRLTCAEN